MIVAGDALKYAKEAILRRCDMAFDTTEAGTATIQQMLERADRIVPGHFPELIRQSDGAFAWIWATSVGQSRGPSPPDSKSSTASPANQ